MGQRDLPDNLSALPPLLAERDAPREIWRKYGEKCTCGGEGIKSPDEEGTRRLCVENKSDSSRFGGKEAQHFSTRAVVKLGYTTMNFRDNYGLELKTNGLKR